MTTLKNDLWGGVVGRAADAAVGDIVIVRIPGSRYSEEKLRRATVTKVGRKWRYFTYDKWGEDRYYLHPQTGICKTDGRGFDQHSYSVFGTLDWEDESLRRWVDEALSAYRMRNFDMRLEWPQKLALARFMHESPLFDVPAPPEKETP